MGRYAGQKRRATTQKSFEVSKDYDKVLTFAKKYHRTEKRFYVVNVPPYEDTYANVSETEFAIQYKNFSGFVEHWIFDEEKNRWKLEEQCEQ